MVHKEAIEAIASISSGKEVKAACRAASALGFIAAGDRSSGTLDAIAQALLGLSNKKSDELQFAAGEALSFSFGGRHLITLKDASLGSNLLLETHLDRVQSLTCLDYGPANPQHSLPDWHRRCLTKGQRLSMPQQLA